MITKIGDFFKKWWPFLVLALAACIIIYIATRGPKIITVIKEDKELIQKAKKLQDENGKLYSQLGQVTVDYRSALALQDSFRRALALKPGEITGIDKYIYKTDTVFRTKVEYLDSSGNKPYYKTAYKDRWLEINAVAGKDTSSISFKQYDTIHRVEVVDKKFIKRDVREVNIYNDNPHSKLVEGYSWTTKQKEPLITIGPSIQYNPFSKKVDFGISLQIPIIKIGRK